MALAGCGANTKTGRSGGTEESTSAVPTAPAKGTGFASAAAERNRLLALAKPGTKITSQGNVPGWPPADGSAIPATPTDVSGFGFNVDKAKNTQYLSFAVTDSRHACAGGDIVTNSKGTTVVSAKPVELPPHAPCTGDQVATQAGHLNGGP
jgi:hypothetical protein